MDLIKNTENVFFFIPNIIGYARVVLAVVSCILMPNNPCPAMWCYMISAGLDALDGHAARFFNQCTKFGAMLDQLTDRCGTACLMVILSTFYPSYAFFFQMSLSVDIAMHWIYLHTSLLQGKSSHKSTTTDEPFILRYYYTNKPFLFTMCVGNELFYVSMYLAHFYDSYFIAFVAVICFPIAVGKWMLAILQGGTAAKNLAGIDAQERQAQIKIQNQLSLPEAIIKIETNIIFGKSFEESTNIEIETNDMKIKRR